jgi:hypothetical protein
MFILEYATHHKDLLPTEVAMRVEVGLWSPANQGGTGALLHERHDVKATDQALVPRGPGGVNDLSVLLVASQVPKLHKQHAAGIAKRRMARPRGIHDVSACGVVARFVAEDTLQNQDLFAHIVVMLREACASIVANDRGGPRYFIAKPLEESSLNTSFWAVDPGKVIVV